MYKFKNVIVGMSGGVDSAVTALLLKKEGYNVQGIFMQNWDIRDEQGFCSSDEDYKDAKSICTKLEIPLHHVSFVKEYWNNVFVNLLNEYENGYTPNPDIMCNKHVKFNYFYKYAREKLNADAIATGHYANTSFGSFLQNFDPNQKVKLLKSLETKKDQTFFLCQIHQDALKRTMFPLGNVMKDEVKLIARQNNLEQIASKKESMGICFIGSRNFQNFISEYIPNKPGKYIDIDTGLQVGEHIGFHQWTVGQRSRVAGLPDCYYIAEKDVNSNTIFVAMGWEHPALFSDTFFTDSPHWICKAPEELANNEVYSCDFKFQHTHSLVKCELCETPKGLIVRLFKPKRALTPGQYAVFYKGEECLGSAKIIYPGPSNFLLNYVPKIYEKKPDVGLKFPVTSKEKTKKRLIQKEKLKQVSF